MTHIAFGVIGEIGTPEKEDQDWTTVTVDYKSLSEGHENFFKYCQGPYIDVDIDYKHL